LILYESPKRLKQLLADLQLTMGGSRQAAICRELTKRFEEISRGPLDALAEIYAAREVKGEIVVLVDRQGEVVADAASVEAALDRALKEMSIKDAAAAIAEAFGMPRREVYQLALRRGAQ
jgi:16S rRNA (cytidine1402-2'-O)-methyltransferase